MMGSVTLRLGLIMVVMSHSACSLLFKESGSDPDATIAVWLDGWAARQSITIDPRRLTSNLENFPVAIVIDANAEIAATSSGTDLAFTLEGSSELLSHEIERYDQVTGALTAWVRVPMLAGEDVTTLHLYYGNSLEVLDDVAGTWATGFAGVWHLAADPTTTSLTRDSGPHRNDGVLQGTLASTTNAPTNAALDFDSVDDCIVIGDPADGSLDFGVDQSFSFSAWVYAESLDTFNAVWSKGGNAEDPGYLLLLGTGPWRSLVSTSQSFKDVVEHSSGAQSLKQWVHLVSVVDRETNVMRAYTDGVLKNVTAPLTALTPATSNEAIIGALTTCSQAPLFGRVDEVRVYDRALSEDWIATEHANLVDPDFLTVGSEQLRP